MDTPFFVLRIVKAVALRPRCGRFKPLPSHFGGASSPVIRQKKNITVRKITHRFHAWTYLFQHNHINPVFVQSTQITGNVCNTAQCTALVFV